MDRAFTTWVSWLKSSPYASYRHHCISLPDQTLLQRADAMIAGNQRKDISFGKILVVELVWHSEALPLAKLTTPTKRKEGGEGLGWPVATSW